MAPGIPRVAGVRSRVVILVILCIVLCVYLSVCQGHSQALPENFLMILRDATLCVLDIEAMTSLSAKATSRLHEAFRPKTRGAYLSMFRTFVAFCIYIKCALAKVDIQVVLSFLECLVMNGCSTSMVENYVSAIKAHFVLHDLSFGVFDHPKLKYFLKALRINRPLSVKSHNIISLDTLALISSACKDLSSGVVYRAVFLVAFFGFFRLSNLAPHAILSFDETRHLTGHDIFFTKDFVKVLLKWTKTIQTRDRVQCVTLPRLHDKRICPYAALKALFKIYPMSSKSSLFQITTTHGYTTLTDSRVRKTLKKINQSLGFNPSFHTFHDFRRSGATFAYNSHIPIQEIKRHGTWSSDCVWRYIQSDHSSGESLAVTLASTINAL